MKLACRILHGSSPFGIIQRAFLETLLFPSTSDSNRRGETEGSVAGYVNVLCKLPLRSYISGTAENDEDFSWEDDEGEDGSATAMPDSHQTLKPHAEGSAPASQANTSTETSPRESSEDSYDLVSGNVSASGEGKEEEEKHKASTAESDGDSDWE